MKIQRVFKSHIFRTIAAALILFSTMFFPLVFAYPSASLDIKGVIVVSVIFGSLFELILFILLNQFCIHAKINNAARQLNAMANGNRGNTLHANSIDNTTTAVLTATNNTLNEYKQLDNARKSFVSNASHELRSPLTSIQGFLQAILDGTATDAEREKYLKIALGETKRLNALITSMLDLSRLESGKNPLIYCKFDINDVIREVIARFEPTLIKKSLQINAEFANNKCFVFADKDKIIQVLVNLIDNAIKYSPAYSRILVLTDIHENKVYISVRDFGYGISKKDQMLIWDRFYMTDKSRSPVKTKGSGLGLSIVKKIVDEHGEVIWVKSSRGAGATFIFTLTLFDPVKHKISKGKILTAAEQSVADDALPKVD